MLLPLPVDRVSEDQPSRGLTFFKCCKAACVDAVIMITSFASNEVSSSQVPDVISPNDWPQTAHRLLSTPPSSRFAVRDFSRSLIQIHSRQSSHHDSPRRPRSSFQNHNFSNFSLPATLEFASQIQIRGQSVLRPSSMPAEARGHGRHPTPLQ